MLLCQHGRGHEQQGWLCPGDRELLLASCPALGNRARHKGHPHLIPVGEILPGTPETSPWAQRGSLALPATVPPTPSFPFKPYPEHKGLCHLCPQGGYPHLRPLSDHKERPCLVPTGGDLTSNPIIPSQTPSWAKIASLPYPHRETLISSSVLFAKVPLGLFPN